MSLLSQPPLLDRTLRLVTRRYRLPAIGPNSAQDPTTSPATSLATAIEQGRMALEHGETSGPEPKRLFLDALARMIRDAMRANSGDPLVQALVLHHRAPSVREYAALSARANQDRRQVLATVNAIAHPGKPQRSPQGTQRQELARLHAKASSSSWSELHDSARHLLEMPEVAGDASMDRALKQLLANPGLGRLQRLDALRTDASVQEYLLLQDRHGPRSGTGEAVAQGEASRQRGAAAEVLAAQAHQELARRLNEAEGTPARYRVATSLRVPASIPAPHDRAKTEWDAVLLQRAPSDDDIPVWNVCLLVEAKTSVDAATTDLPRLQRGLQLLARARTNATYDFESAEETIRLSGASLSALETDQARLANTVLYCCNALADAPADAPLRLLGAASRMQLLSAQASLHFASALAENHHPDSEGLEPVWQQLLHSPRWSAVLNQFPVLRQARELMVHTDDLFVAMDAANMTASPRERKNPDASIG